MPRRLSAIRSRIAVVALLTTFGLGVVACAPTPEPTPTAEATQTASPEPTTTAEEPVLVPDGTAEENLPLFAAVTEQVWGASGSSSGQAYIDALVAAGFDQGTMQVTQDLTTVGNPVESMQFSVRWGDAECLVGQVGPSTGDPVTMVMDQLAEGRCLVGNTRPIEG
ncbi:DUF6993 domain-containing protein [Microbacterium sp.]|uniref:DUF6993 domain-containing protein n=1 Tax=Microbacterium sp. TaxID=51671 RepID=UPI003F9631AA